MGGLVETYHEVISQVFTPGCSGPPRLAEAFEASEPAQAAEEAVEDTS